jgi:membrane protein implicated in regulation of membrane protease activity
MQTLSQIGIAYIVGGTLFGIALFRANLLPRWAAALLTVGAVATLATPFLPELIQGPLAVPVSVALIGLGYSLWREQRTPTAQPLHSPASSQLGSAGAQ